MIVGKPGSHKRALRRHHDKRKKAWVRKTLCHYFTYVTDLPPRRVGLYSRTPKVCSCFMCGNPRRFHQEPSIQERRAIFKTHDIERQPAIPYPKQPKAVLGNGQDASQKALYHMGILND